MVHRWAVAAAAAAAEADVAETSGATLLTGGRVGGRGVNTENSLFYSGLQKVLDAGTSFASSATLFDEAYGNHIKV